MNDHRYNWKLFQVYQFRKYYYVICNIFIYDSSKRNIITLNWINFIFLDSMYPNVCCIKKNNKSTIDILYNIHFQSCMKTRKIWKGSANKYKPIESRVSFSTSPTLTLFRNIRIQRSGIEFTRVCKPTRLRTNSHNALATFHVASRTKKEREREKEKMKRETRGETWNEKDRKNRTWRTRAPLPLSLARPGCDSTQRIPDL